MNEEPVPWVHGSLVFSQGTSLYHHPSFFLLACGGPSDQDDGGTFCDDPRVKARQEWFMAHLTLVHSLAFWRTASMLTWHIWKNWRQNLGSIAFSVFLPHGHTTHAHACVQPPSQGKDDMYRAWPFFLQEWVEWDGLKKAKSAACLPLISLSLKRTSTGPAEAFPTQKGAGMATIRGVDLSVLGAPGTHFFLPQVMVPSLDDIQQAINRMIQLTLEVSRGVAHWGQQSRPIKRVISSTSRTTMDFAHPSTGKQLKKEESKNIKSQTSRVSEL